MFSSFSLVEIFRLLEELNSLMDQNISSLLSNKSIIVWIDLNSKNTGKIYSIISRLEQEDYLDYIQIAPTQKMQAMIGNYLSNGFR